MEERYFTPKEMLIYFKKNELSDDILEGSCFAISPIDDVIYWIENANKGNIKVDQPFNQLLDRFKLTDVFIADLDSEQLHNSLFHFSEDELTFWNKAISLKLNPKYSISFLSLKDSPSKPWSEKVLLQMEEFHQL